MIQYITSTVDDDLRQRLIQIARQKATATYSELDPTAPVAVARKLDLINTVELYEGRPMLSALVVAKDSGKPGVGFFLQALTSRRFDGNDCDAFWREELQRVWNYWDDGKEPD